jgi:hypothetical protein
MTRELLPDCRAQHPSSIFRGTAGIWVPVFCANCGAEGGLVPSEGMTFLFYLCNTCAETYGQLAGTMLMPDELYYERLAQEQLARYGRYLTPREWGQISEDPAHPMWTVIQSKGE